MATRDNKLKTERRQGQRVGLSTYRVFISHSSLDIWIAERMAEKVAGATADYWLDVRDLEGGGDIREEINKGVRESQELIVLLSPNSVDSHWVSFEIGAASVKRRHLTPILNNVNYNDVQLIQGMKAIDLNNFDQYLVQMKKRMKKWLDRRK